MVIHRASQVSLVVKNPPANAEDSRDEGSVPGWEDPLEEEMAPHSSIHAGIIYRQRRLVGYSPWDQELDTTDHLTM